MENNVIKLSIIVVHLGSDNLIINFLDSLYQSYLPFDFETIIVDNKSNSKNLYKIVNQFKNCRIVELEKRLGYSNASNAGIIKSSGEFVLWCNNDLLFQYDSLFNLYDFLISNNDYGIVSPCLLNEDNSTQPCYSLYNLNLFTIVFNLTGFISSNSNKSFDIKVAPGACCMIRKSALEPFGYVLPNNYYMYCEEFDLSYKVLKNNYKIRYIGNSKVVHLGGNTTKKTSINFLIQSLKSKFKYLKVNENIVEAHLFYLYLLFKFLTKTVIFLILSILSQNYNSSFSINKKIFFVLFKKNFFKADDLIFYYND